MEYLAIVVTLVLIALFFTERPGSRSIDRRLSRMLGASSPRRTARQIFVSRGAWGR